MVWVSYLFLITSVGAVMAIFVLCFQHKHLLNVLLSLEALTLNLFSLLVCACTFSNFEGYMCLILITMGACEASLGLAVLVSLIRAHGNDYVKSLSSQRC